MVDCTLHKILHWISIHIGYEHTIHIKDGSLVFFAFIVGFIVCFLMMSWILGFMIITPQLTEKLNNIFLKCGNKTNILINPKHGLDIVDTLICFLLSSLLLRKQTVFFKSARRVKITFYSLLGLVIFLCIVSFKIYTYIFIE